jgi:hypothetical protein
MRLECQQAKFPTVGTRDVARRCNHMLVTPMKTIEISQRDHGALTRFGHIRKVSKYTHLRDVPLDRAAIKPSRSIGSAGADPPQLF